MGAWTNTEVIFALLRIKPGRPVSSDLNMCSGIYNFSLTRYQMKDLNEHVSLNLLTSRHVKTSCHLVDAPWWHGAVVEAQKGSDDLLTPSPVTLTPQVQRVVVPRNRLRQIGRQTGVQVRFVLTQARLRGQKPGPTGTLKTGFTIESLTTCCDTVSKAVIFLFLIQL